MREYELIYVVRPDLADDQIASEQEYVRNAVKAMAGEIVKESDWGIKPLPFVIKKYKEGRFNFLVLKMNPDGPDKLKYELKINDRIIRHMITCKIPGKVGSGKKAEPVVVTPDMISPDKDNPDNK